MMGIDTIQCELAFICINFLVHIDFIANTFFTISTLLIISLWVRTILLATVLQRYPIDFNRLLIVVVNIFSGIKSLILLADTILRPLLIVCIACLIFESALDVRFFTFCARPTIRWSLWIDCTVRKLTVF